MRADIAVYDKKEQLVAVIEVKNKKGMSKDWAIKLRRNLFAHGLWPEIKYFILALPDRLYIWSNTTNMPVEVEPDYEIDITELLKPFYERSGISLEQISQYGFELILISWLNEVIQTASEQPDNKKIQDSLIKSGLFEALKTGRIVTEVEI